ncbi:MAG TPA: hypothetical protein VIL74_02395 [Pyrinomonadaceae bacterium]
MRAGFRSGGRGLDFRFRQRVLLDLAVKAVAAPPQGFDHRQAVRRFAQNLSQDIDVLVEIRFFDRSICPEPFHQIFLADDFAVSFHQREQGLDLLRSQRNGFAVAVKHQMRRRQTKFFKLVNFRIRAFNLFEVILK